MRMSQQAGGSVLHIILGLALAGAIWTYVLTGIGLYITIGVAGLMTLGLLVRRRLVGHSERLMNEAREAHARAVRDRAAADARIARRRKATAAR